MSKENLVFVDRGHAGLRKDGTADPSATPGKETPYIRSLGRRIQEEEFNQPVKDLLIKELKRCGVVVIDVTPTSKDTPLKERTDYANKIYWQYCREHGRNNVNAIYVSIHFNAFDGTFSGPNPSGFSAHVYLGDSKNKSGKLANYILDELENGTKQINRGLKENNFHVLRETDFPAVLTENGFMDHPEEAMLMLNTAFQKEVAQEHARGICKYFEVAYVPEPKPQPVVSGETYTIQKGDTYWGLENEFGMKHGTLQNLNPGIDPLRLQVGQEIVISAAIQYHVIVKGDTFWALENKFKLAHGTLQKLNPKVDPGRLQIGQRIRIK